MTGVADTEAIPSPKTIALVGVGSMGRPMAHHIREAGFGLTVCDNRPGALAEFADIGARTTQSPADCANCDAILILVATAAQLHAVVTGAGGVLAGVKRRASVGRPLLLVVGSTVAPDDIHVLARACSGLGVHLVDAPVSGGVVGARQGSLTFLAGGNADDIDALRPLFDSMGTTTLHCGPLGAGMTTKAVNNMIAISNLMISAEAYRIALANGLQLDELIPALDAGSARNFLSRETADYARDVYAAWSGTREEYLGVQSINRKDIDLAIALGGGDLQLPALSALRRLLADIGEETLENWRAVADSARVPRLDE